MEDNMDEIQAKQTLLQTEIIEKNYDKTAFINFCLSKKENGDDLNNWTLDELTEIVHEFVASQNPQPETTITVQSTDTKAPGKDGEQEIKKEDIEKMEKFNAEETKNFKEKVINCKKLDKNDLSDKKLVITVSNPKEVDGGVFGKNYVLYEVKTEPFNWVVQRRFSDFDNLRKLIAKHFPSFYVPPLPNKKMGNRRFETSFINKRMKFLNLFINNLVQSESFKASHSKHLKFFYPFCLMKTEVNLILNLKNILLNNLVPMLKNIELLMEKLPFLMMKEMKNISLTLINISDYKDKS